MEIKTLTADEVLPIRHQVLWPDKPESFCRVEGDEQALHYGALVNDRLVCVASVYLDGKTARLRKFATLEDYQGQGIGTKILEHTIASVRALGIDYYWCDARVSAQDFYKKFGLAVEGEAFNKSGIWYFKMSVDWSEKRT
ncbi:GNAT family N-acetyltransferase [Vibrio maritimus]|uniref:GNAT family N-acetyltransferase n=1 Tax=Vibrio maritimus TaxID=990268 RepID=UPI001F1D5E41|nr:GNAT family N-acetyltransferase [Vibrio maritimus]